MTRTITFNTTDGKSRCFEGEEARDAYCQYLNPKHEGIFIPGEVEVYIAKRHIISAVLRVRNNHI